MKRWAYEITSSFLLPGAVSIFIGYMCQDNVKVWLIFTVSVCLKLQYAV